MSQSAKRTKCSVAAIIRRPDDDRFLAVRRPDDDDHLPNVWGLPAVTLYPGELPEAAVRRIGREKLGVAIEPARLVGIKDAERDTYRLILMDIEAILRSGEPDCQRASGTGTRYTDQLWTSDLDLLVEAAMRGSLCCQILLDSAGRPYGGIS